MKTRSCRAVARLAAVLLGAVLAACSGDGDDGDTQATPPFERPVEQPGVLRTLAAWAGALDPGGPGYRDGMGPAARFQQPHGMALTSDGSIWVSEPEMHRIRRIDAQGMVRTALHVDALAPRSDAGGRRITLVRPGPLVAGPGGQLFVAVQQYTRDMAGGSTEDARWVVLRIAPDAEPTVVALPGIEAGVGYTATALALDRQGRLHVADMRCTIWRTDGEVLATPRPRAVQLVHASAPGSPGRACEPFTEFALNPEAVSHAITRLAFDADDRLLFTLARGDVKRIEPGGHITTLGQVSATGLECSGMVLDRAGQLLLTGGSPALVRLNAAGHEQTVAGAALRRGWFDGPATVARFESLCAMAIDREGGIVLVDRGGHTVRRIAADGSVSTVAGLALQAAHRDGTGAEARFGSFFAIGPGPGATVVVADPATAVVRRVDAQQRVTTLAGVPDEWGNFSRSDGPVASARFGFPSQALMTADGSLWIGDGTTLRRLGSDGMVRTLATRHSHGALAMALDRAGDVLVAWGGAYFSNEGGGSYQHFERYAAGMPQAAPDRMEATLPAELATRLGSNTVRGLCALPDGTLVYSQGNAVLRRAPDGTVSLLAGSPDEAGGNDGAAALARFNFPRGLACDAAGGIYVADSGNHTVRYIDAQRRVRTVLGTAGRAGWRIDALPGELHEPSSVVLVPGGLIVGTGMGMVRAGF